VSNFVLVHGGLHGGWCWERIVPRLLAAGHRAEAIDLPGSDRRIAAGRVSLESCREATVAALEQAEEPVILCGHSLGGRSISAAAETRPELVRTLVYLTALVPGVAGGPPLPQPANDNVIANGFFPADDGASVMLGKAAAVAGFYSDCSAEDADAAFSRLVPLPVRTMNDPLLVTWERWGRIERHYIFTLNDRTIPIAMQREMVATMPGTHTHEIPSGHSPFYSHPDELTAILLGIAAERAART
jgi:pimeloyl-ACP methyl ester carboxylesterase